jgi:hypothetical protein
MVIFAMVLPLATAQQDHFARLSVTSDRVLAGQAFRVKISVYTPTWFTRAPDFGEYQVANSFTLRTDRPQSTYETIDGKRYTTLNYEYLVFPMISGKLELPALEVAFESPVEGDYKGKPVTVRTNVASVQVTPLPGGPEGAPPFAAENVHLTQSWNRPLSDLRVGDMIELTIRINITGSLANMIPPLVMDTIDWASRYTKTPALLQSLSGSMVVASRTEKHTYLLEQDGTFSFPEIRISWYRIRTGTWESFTLEPISLTVADNPDLAILRTLQDSLMAETQTLKEEEDAQGTGLFGYSLKQVFTGLGVIGATVLLIIFTWQKSINWYRNYRARYRSSEPYHFYKLVKATRRLDLSHVNQNLYRWLDSHQSQLKVNSVNDLAEISGNPELSKAVDSFHRILYGTAESGKPKSTDRNVLNELRKHVRRSRKRISASKQDHIKYKYRFN